jgi:hypothetical protein
MTRGWMAGAALLAVLGGPGLAAADPVERPIAATVTRILEAPATGGEAWTLAGSTAGATAAVARQPMPGNPGGPNRSRGNRVGRAIAGAAVGAVGGAFAGGYLGAALEPDCNCDDPGLKGFLIGFPVGGVVGGVLGGFYLFR